MIPSGRLWITLCLLTLPTLVAGFVPGIRALVLLLDFSLLAFALVDFVIARRARIKVSRHVPNRLSVGVANKIELDVINTSGRAWHLRIKDDVPEEFSADPEELALKVSAQSRARLAYKVVPVKRGKFAFGPVHVRVRGPAGLMWHERTLPIGESVAVFPDLRGASRLLLSDAALDLVNLGLRQLRRDGRGSEFARLRDYAQGDSVREVDWKATARRTRPVTRVFESERSQTLLIGVDAGRSMAARVDGLTKLDHAVNAALFLAFVAIKNGDRVGLVVFADGVKSYLAPNNGRTQYRKIVDALYSARPHLTYVDYLALFKELNVRLLRRSLLCVFTDFIDEDQASTMVDPMRRLARRHVPLCLSVKDTALASLLRTPPPEAETAYQHSVASELLLEREAMKRKIGQGGVQMIDVNPDELSLAAVNKYLEIKARGVL
ncbi:MAG: DUF58 domain-containing protein [Myxococcaceae bacterium]|nr:DUF58 domain-containing protein [Myxococcaceae bacterium]